MTSEKLPENLLTQGLTALAEMSFPKRCKNCGQIYETLEEFVAGTSTPGLSGSGLKESEDDDGEVIVELFRNCLCGSTLMEFCGNRREESQEAQKRRDKFNQLLILLEQRGMDRETARAELRKLIRGVPSPQIAVYLKAEIKI